MKEYSTVREERAYLLKEGDYRSIRDIIERIAKIVPDNQILAELNPKKEIVYYNSVDVYEEVMNLGDGLIDAGLGNTHIAICATNSCRYIFADISISSGVGVVVPVDRDASVELLVTLLSKCDADAILCSTDCVDRIREAQKSLPLLKTIITIEGKVDGCLWYDDIVARGRELKENSIYRNLTPDPDAPAKILFTSGTTGPNKGVVLTNTNLAANTMNCMDTIKIRKNENISMSVLPMHHATEINTHIMARIGGGDLTYINDSIRNMMTNIKIFKPDVITIVPMIANAFHKNILAGAKKAGKIEKLQKGIKLSNILRKIGIDKTHSMFADVYEPFGGRLHMIVCGGSMLNPVIVKGLSDLGIRMENGYGITECGPLISMNADTLNEHLSVGKPCPGLEVKIVNPDENGVGELAVRGKSVAKGYYKDEEATKKVFLPDGFFLTGDSAYIDNNGKIFLVGKKKNTIVLQNGKNICPEELENILESSLDYVTEAVVYQATHDYRGDIQPVLVAGLYIEDPSRRADRDAIKAAVRDINANLPSFKAIDYIELTDVPYERTSSKKIKRTTLPDTCSGTGISIS